MARIIGHIIDKAIHSNYFIYKNNYIAYDVVNECSRFSDKYSEADKDAFNSYLDNQIKKTDIQLDDNDCQFMKHMMLIMYANPLTNQLAALDE